MSNQKHLIEDFKKKLQADIEEKICMNLDNFGVVVNDNKALGEAITEVLQDMTSKPIVVQEASAFDFGSLMDDIHKAVSDKSN